MDDDNNTTAYPVLPPLRPQSIVDIFTASTKLYAAHWRPFTRVLLPSMLYQVLGIYGSVIGAYFLMDYFEARVIAGDPAAFTMLFVTLIPWMLATVALFCMGFWQYVVYFASLNINCAEVIQGKTPDFKTAYRAIEAKTWPYAFTLKLLIVVQIAWFFTSLGSFVWALYSKQPWNVIIFLSGQALSILLLTAGVLLSVYFSMVFQVVAFEAITLNAFNTARKSFAYVWNNFWRTVTLFLVLSAFTGLIAPTLFTVIARPLQLLLPVDLFHQWFVKMLLEGMQPSLDYEIPLDTMMSLVLKQPSLNPYQLLMSQLPAFAAMCTDSLISLLMTALMLPWGTFAYTLLYGDLRARYEARHKAPQPAIEPPGEADV